MIRIIGIGSPFGDDAAGLEAARRLAAAPPPGTEVMTADRPGAALIDLLDGADAAILIDAAHSGAPPGTIHDLDLHELPQHGIGLLSSHDLGVAEAVLLSTTLHRTPARGRVLGIETPPLLGSPLLSEYEPTSANDPLSPPVRAAVEEAVIRARQWAERFDGRIRRRLTITGTVQGVGFRPFVWHLATSLGLSGLVRNAPVGVQIEIEGPARQLDAFRDRVVSEAPPHAEIADVRVEPCAGVAPAARGFVVVPSDHGSVATMIPPDLATCPDCLREVLDPTQRRFRYPFTNCTACGPRFTVVEALPYDRATTTLKDFPLCEACAREYFDPDDRRFHAEPVACPRCGPQAWLEVQPGSVGCDEERDAIAAAAHVLARGAVVAVQGIGGVHLACDATNEEAVRRLRQIKRRPHKPLAVMVPSLEAAERLAVLSPAERVLLASPQAPIVLAERRTDTPIAVAVAPGNDHIGLMLAYSPLHHLLLRDVGRPLVMTSANRPGEPLGRTAEEARATIGRDVDALLLHNRPIHQRCDDGVWMVTAHGPQPIRVSRGTAPQALAVPVETPVPILAIGADIKNSFCLLSGRRALISQYIGTIEHVATQEHFRDALEKWMHLTAIDPACVAHDLHPASPARALAERLGLPTIGVQHHHAHIAACLAEHGVEGPAIGIAFDGTGYGLDGAIWGGEAVIADLTGFRRAAHLEYLPLPGGDATIRHPARTAFAYLLALGLEGTPLLEQQQRRIVGRMVERGIQTVPTSSAGRLFDAVAALLGVCADTTYEAQAAIELETIARRSAAPQAAYPFTMDGEIVRLRALFEAILSDLRAGKPVALIARRFHLTMAEIVVQMACTGRNASGLSTVALSGGCFQNRLLLADAIARLEAEGCTVLTHRHVPANDNGLSLGQAVVVAAQLAAARMAARGSSCA